MREGRRTLNKTFCAWHWINPGFGNGQEIHPQILPQIRTCWVTLGKSQFFSVYLSFLNCQLRGLDFLVAEVTSRSESMIIWFSGLIESNQWYSLLSSNPHRKSQWLNIPGLCFSLLVLFLICSFPAALPPSWFIWEANRKPSSRVTDQKYTSVIQWPLWGLSWETTDHPLYPRRI